MSRLTNCLSFLIIGVNLPPATFHQISIFLPKQNEIEILILKDSSPQAGIEQFKHCQIDIPIEDENNGTNDTMDNHFEDWFDQENTHIHLAEYEIKRIE